MDYRPFFEVASPQGEKMVFVLLTLLSALFNMLITVTAEADVCNLGPGIVPEEPYFLEHQDIVLECISHQESKNLTFLLGRDKQPVDKMCNTTETSQKSVHSQGLGTYLVDTMCIWERNSTYVKLVIPRVTANDVREYKQGKHVKCIDIGDDPYTCIDNDYIQLEYFPIEPENITCLVDNFETLLCTWDLGPVYKFPRNMTITCQYAFNVSTKINISPERVREGWSKCPNGTSTSCFWDSRQYHNSKTILLNVSVTNLVKNITVSRRVTVLRDDVLKPAKVKNLRVRYEKDPMCVSLSWEPPYLFRNYTKYNISYSSQCQSKEKVIEYFCDGYYSSYCLFELCGLNPFSLYNVDIVSRYSPNWTETGYWSDPTEIIFTTNKARPQKGPLVTDGLYQYDGQYLTLYWQPLGECDQYSDDTEYEISVNGVTKTCPASAILMEMRLQHGNKSSQAFVAQILTKNSYGTENNTLTLQIFPEGVGPIDSELIIEYKRNESGCEDYFATIKIDDSNFKEFSNITHTITWCNISAGACNGPMHWLENVTTIYKLHLPLWKCNETYKFWLITKAYHKSTQNMVWTDINPVNCKYQLNTVPKEPLPNVRLSKVMLHNTVSVEWEPYPCTESTGYIENYIFTYCKAEPPQNNDTCACIQKRKYIHVSNKKSSYTLKDLESNLELCVWVSANSSAGQGPKNKHVLFYKVEAGEDKSYVIIVAVTLAGVAAFFIFVLLTWQCKNRIKSWLENMRDVEDPVVGPETNGEPQYREPEGAQYQTSEQPPENGPLLYDSAIEWALTSDSESETSYIDTGNVIDGYTPVRNIIYTSKSSVNSELSQMGGDPYVETMPGDNVTVKALVEKSNDSMSYGESDDQSLGSKIIPRSATNSNRDLHVFAENGNGINEDISGWVKRQFSNETDKATSKSEIQQIETDNTKKHIALKYLENQKDVELVNKSQLKGDIRETDEIMNGDHSVDNLNETLLLSKHCVDNRLSISGTCNGYSDIASGIGLTAGLTDNYPIINGYSDLQGTSGGDSLIYSKAILAECATKEGSGDNQTNSRADFNSSELTETKTQCPAMLQPK